MGITNFGEIPLMLYCCTAKTPLRYQATQFDCVPVTFLNAISCLYRRIDIPTEVVRNLYNFTLDSLNTKGRINGSSIHSIELIAQWLNSYKTANFDTIAVMRYGRQVSFDEVEQYIKEGGIAILELKMWRYWHYVLLMGIDDSNYYCFDPYYRSYIRNLNPKIQFLKSDGFKPNRCIDKRWLFSYRKNKIYCLGSTTDRVVILVRKGE